MRIKTKQKTTHPKGSSELQFHIYKNLHFNNLAMYTVQFQHKRTSFTKNRGGGRGRGSPRTTVVGKRRRCEAFRTILTWIRLRLLPACLTEPRNRNHWNAKSPAACLLHEVFLKPTRWDWRTDSDLTGGHLRLTRLPFQLWATFCRMFQSLQCHCVSYGVSFPAWGAINKSNLIKIIKIKCMAHRKHGDKPTASARQLHH